MDKWDLSRKPTKREKISAAIFSFILLMFTSLGLYVNASMLLEGEASFSSFIVVSILFLGALVLFVRSAFFKRKKLTQKAIRYTGYVLFGLSCSMFILPFIVSNESANILYMFSAGLTGIAGSKLIISQGSKNENP